MDRLQQWWQTYGMLATAGTQSPFYWHVGQVTPVAEHRLLFFVLNPQYSYLIAVLTLCDK